MFLKISRIICLGMVKIPAQEGLQMFCKYKLNFCRSPIILIETMIVFVKDDCRQEIFLMDFSQKVI